MPGDAMGCVPGQNCVYVCLAPDEQQEPIFSLARQLVAEAVGSALLVATIVGSGLQAVQLSTDDGVALLGNTVATLGILYVLITVFGKVSGAHFNPLVVSPSSLATQRASPARTPVSPTPRISARSANHCPALNLSPPPPIHCLCARALSVGPRHRRAWRFAFAARWSLRSAQGSWWCSA